MSIEAADILRKLAVGQAFVISVLTVWTLVRFAKKALTVPKVERALPTHVALICASYLLLVVYVVSSLYDKLGELPTWRIPLGMTAFTLGVGALVYLMAHLSVRRTLKEAFRRKVEAEASKELARQMERTERRMQRMEEVAQHTHDKVFEMQEGDVKLAQSVENVGEKADLAYHEANDLNLKIAGFNKEVSGKLTDIKDNAEIARKKASDVSDKADTIGDTGKDTNVRVRKIERHGREN